MKCLHDVIEKIRSLSGIRAETRGIAPTTRFCNLHLNFPFEGLLSSILCCC